MSVYYLRLLNGDSTFFAISKRKLFDKINFDLIEHIYTTNVPDGAVVVDCNCEVLNLSQDKNNIHYPCWGCFSEDIRRVNIEFKLIWSREMKKIRVYDQKKYLGKKIRVFKNDFELWTHDLGNDPYYSISKKDAHGGFCIIGGDSTYESCYDKNYVLAIFKEWNGILSWSNVYGYTVDL